MNVLIIEDEKWMAQKFRDLLNEIDESINIVGVTDNVNSAVMWLKENKAPDLILANKSTIDEIEKNDSRNIRAIVTISTINEEFNFEAFRLKHLRYILDNMSITEERISLDHLEKPAVNNITRTAFKERFLVKLGQKLLSIPISQVAYFFSQDRFIFLKTLDNQKFLVEYRIEQLEKILPPEMFFRINRSHIISLGSVREIHAYFGNRLKIYLTPSTEKEVIVSRKRVSDFKQWLGK
jgi:two-component system response regulator LytT